MSEMIELAAAAMYDKYHAKLRYPTAVTWARAPDVSKTLYRELASAAIEAMREPTEAMAMIEVDYQEHTAAEIYRRMIDAALK